MRAKNCGMLLVVGAAMFAACRGEGPTAPIVLTLEPYCVGFCIGPPEVPIDRSWLSHLSGVAGAPLSLAIAVTDRHASPISGVKFRWRVVGHGGSVDSTTSESDTAGVVRVRWTLDTLIASDSLIGYLPSGDSIVAVAAVQHASPATFIKASGDSQTVAVGSTPAPFAIRVTDRYGNPVPGVTVAWTTGGLGSVVALTTRTGTDGTTTNNIAAPSVAGVYAVIATFGTIPAMVFRVDVR